MGNTNRGLISVVVLFVGLIGYQALPNLRPKPIKPFLFGTAGKQHDDERLTKIAVFKEVVRKIDSGDVKSPDDYKKFVNAGLVEGRNEAAKPIRAELQEIENKADGKWDPAGYKKITERFILELGG